ncbi:MAG: hypothetical protein UU09_C0032G0005 [Microgenomates group bacterium GW2011_GWA2_40_6]|nr:MAG: hypothetical protein UU09_C0032G0005 [Microgenomates group bacterium GW2011_GWA2_40_6]
MQLSIGKEIHWGRLLISSRCRVQKRFENWVYFLPGRVDILMKLSEMKNDIGR